MYQIFYEKKIFKDLDKIPAYDVKKIKEVFQSKTSLRIHFQAAPRKSPVKTIYTECSRGTTESSILQTQRKNKFISSW